MLRQEFFSAYNASISLEQQRMVIMFTITLLWLPSTRRTRKSSNRNPWGKNKAPYLSVNVFSTKVLIGDTISYVSYWRRDRHFTWSSEPREGLPVCRAKAVPSFLSYFKTLGIGLAPGNKPAASRSAVKHSTDAELIVPRVALGPSPFDLLQLLNIYWEFNMTITLAHSSIHPNKCLQCTRVEYVFTFVGFGSTQHQGCR